MLVEPLRDLLVGWGRLPVRRDTGHLLPTRALWRFRAGRRVCGRALENHLRERDLVFQGPCVDSFQDRLAIAGWDRHDAAHLQVAVLYRNCSTSCWRHIRLLPGANRVGAAVVAEVRRARAC